MLSGHLPEWPFKWPPPGHSLVKRRVHPELLDIVRRAIELDPRKRFADAGAMLSALRRVKRRALHYSNGKLSTVARGKKLTTVRNGKGSKHR
jgi:serine/threonine-protein kinase